MICYKQLHGHTYSSDFWSCIISTVNYLTPMNSGHHKLTAYFKSGWQWDKNDNSHNLKNSFHIFNAVPKRLFLLIMSVLINKKKQTRRLDSFTVWSTEMGFCVQPLGVSGLATPRFLVVQARIHAPLNCYNNKDDWAESVDAACSSVNIQPSFLAGFIVSIFYSSFSRAKM